MSRRLSKQSAAVLRLFACAPEREAFGREVILETGVPSGSLYPILHRLESIGYLTSAWEGLDDAVEAGRRPRRTYRLDPRGAHAAIAALAASAPVHEVAAELQQRRVRVSPV